MRLLPDGMAEALTGSVMDARLVCHAWYDGELVAPDLEVSGWSLEWARGPQTQVQGTAKLTVVDQTGALAPWGYDEPLSVAGSQIQTSFVAAGERVGLGWWVLTGNTPEESWRAVGDEVLWVPSGSTIPVDAAELTQLIQDSRFIAPESPVGGATVFSELRRLLEGICPVYFNGVLDEVVPQNMVYREERINTVFDLVGMIGECRMSGDGILEVYDPSFAGSLWGITPGPGGNLVNVQREQTRDDLYNAVVATSQDTGHEIRMYDLLDYGPLRFDGPLGRKPMFKTSMADHHAGVLTDAQTTLRNRAESATTVLQVQCAPNPAYQIGDWGTVAQPVIGGEVFPLVGQVTGISLSGGPEGVEPMSVEVECSTADVQRVARHVRRNL